MARSQETTTSRKPPIYTHPHPSGSLRVRSEPIELNLSLGHPVYPIYSVDV